MNTRSTTRQGAPELALRLRIAATILTRATCLVARDGRLKSGLSVRDMSLPWAIRAVKRELYPDPRSRRHDGEPEEAACNWALAQIWQEPVDSFPSLRDLIRAAIKLRDRAYFEAAGDLWVVTEGRAA
ncbi:hypothetical protein [Luteolibacter marinus]|uniref:hypothetical protein n=1 Tax=Luteolibacter marinus TaxID=2776705 RepID=UPI001868DE45|nr:hypothetical protein [Luteolibacter marinus]